MPASCHILEQLGNLSRVCSNFTSLVVERVSTVWIDTATRHDSLSLSLSLSPALSLSLSLPPPPSPPLSLSLSPSLSPSLPLPLFPHLAKNIDLDIDDVDYVRILEGGNFIHFVAIVYDATDKLSVVKTANYRLRVSPSQDPPPDIA